MSKFWPQTHTKVSAPPRMKWRILRMGPAIEPEWRARQVVWVRSLGYPDRVVRQVPRLRGLEERVVEGRRLIAVVDDDESVRESLPDLLRVFGFDARTFASAEEFLGSNCIASLGCLILDIAMPGMSGPELWRELSRRGCAVPTIFITAGSTESIPPGLLQQGVDCLFKPFSEQDLRAALDAALPRT
jgi:CheY-like chemotaxis protein